MWMREERERDECGKLCPAVGVLTQLSLHRLITAVDTCGMLSLRHTHTPSHRTSVARLMVVLLLLPPRRLLLLFQILQLPMLSSLGATLCLTFLFHV